MKRRKRLLIGVQNHNILWYALQFATICGIIEAERGGNMFLSVKETANRLSLSAATVRKLCRAGALPSIRYGRKIQRIPEAALSEKTVIDNAIESAAGSGEVGCG